MNKKSIQNLGIGVLILLLSLLAWRQCKPESPVAEEKLPNWFSDEVDLIPQVGNYACWAASLNMMKKGNAGLNRTNTMPIHTDSLAAHLPDYMANNLSQMQDLDWEKIKNELVHRSPMAVYKYYNPTFAHVFVVRGYHQSDAYKWLLINDPWPVHKAKITALDFRNLTRPFDGKATYQTIAYKPSSSSTKAYSEANFNIYSANPLSGESHTAYKPIAQTIDNSSEVRVQNTKSILGELHEEFKKIDPAFFKAMHIAYAPQKDQLNIDFNGAVLLNNFNDAATFMNYNLKHSQKPDYLFNATLQVYTTFKKADEPLITTTVDYEDKTSERFLYVSRFESYGNSVMADCDSILNDFIQAFKKPALLKLLQPLLANLKSTQNLQPEIADWASLPVYGGPVFSFILKGYNEKIVADPYKQLILKQNQKALFIGESGIPYYRLSAVELPEYGEIVKAKSREEIPVEWAETNSKPNTKPISSPNTGVGTNQKDSTENHTGTGIKSPQPIGGIGKPIPQKEIKKSSSKKVDFQNPVQKPKD
ncbi:hypothetical protein LAG90_09710 [Marinilongibacter aquaticus]|uniref:papain-like cysteine protease family protein n=1 Tax=Marinilongibacter aquaticus TaxID=2975157 RepID=UPI0021BDECB4|nr:papain-like cysteine protease family protein [Marinilongibacter aquaticus]UBM60908.1 hypothetical protein LAG90_09710 [Marinilongibacter aquaticus]